MASRSQGLLGLVQEGDLQGAEAFAKEALAADPGSVDVAALGLLIARLFAGGRARAARALLESGRPFEIPNPPEVYNLISFLEVSRGDRPAARKALQEGLRAHPRSALLLCSLGVLHWEAEDRRGALDAWALAGKESPGWTRLDYLVAVVAMGEPVESPAPASRETPVRAAPLHLLDLPGPVDWYSGLLSRDGEGWRLVLSPQDGADPALLVSGIRLILVASDEHGLYVRRADVMASPDPYGSGIRLKLIEPLHKVQRRRHVRILAHHVAGGTYQVPGEKPVPLKATDLSASGISFSAPEALPVGTSIRLSLTVDPEGVRGPAAERAPGREEPTTRRLHALVVRCSPRAQRFIVSTQFEIQTKDQDALARLIHMTQLILRRAEREER